MRNESSRVRLGHLTPSQILDSGGNAWYQVVLLVVKGDFMLALATLVIAGLELVVNLARLLLEIKKANRK